MIDIELEIIKISYEVDEFCRMFIPEWNKHLIELKEKQRIRKDCLTESEIITIMIIYHNSRIKNFKTFYKYFRSTLISYFPSMPDYTTFLKKERRVIVPLLALIQYKKGEETGIYYIDSTPLAVCKNQRIYRHKTFKDIAKRGISSMGWFFGFKVNNRGQRAICLTMFLYWS